MGFHRTLGVWKQGIETKEEIRRGMGRIIIRGGHRLEGDVWLSGSKNSCLALMAASLLAEGVTVLDNVPRIGDVETMSEMLSRLGVRVKWIGEHRLEIDTRSLATIEAPYDLVRRMRASFNILGPLLARTGHARVAQPGGCDIGTRGIDYHIKGLRMMGAHIEAEHGFIEARTPRLKGAHIFLDYPSVGATCHLLTSAVLAEGETIIENSAIEPEIVDLARMLRLMGAQIHGAGTRTLRVQGVRKLTPVCYRAIPDRIEAGTWLIAAGITQGDILIRNAVVDHITPILLKLREMGLEIEVQKPSLRVFDEDFTDPEPVAMIRAKGPHRPKATDFVVTPHPGFPTDMQPPIVALLSISQGTAVVKETVFDRRFRYVEELNRMGANITVSEQTAVVKGVENLTGTHVNAPDLRGGVALMLAALRAQGETEVGEVHHIDRGYEDLVPKLLKLGADALYEKGKGLSSVSLCLA